MWRGLAGGGGGGGGGVACYIAEALVYDRLANLEDNAHDVL